MSRIGKTICNLRKRMGASQQKLADWLGVSRPTITQIELGNRELDSLDLFKIADFFGCTVSDLLSDDLDSIETVGIRFRRVLDIDENEEIWHAVIRSIKLAREVASLKDILGIETEDERIPGYSLPGPKSKLHAVRQGERIAVEERKRLCLGDARIEDVIDILESQNIFAGEIDMTEDVSGFTLILKEIGSVCLVNSEHNGARKRFSYAHEYGHVLMDFDLTAIVSKKSERADLIEVRANAFAASLLIPASGCNDMVRRIGKGKPSREKAEVFDGEEAISVEERHIVEDSAIQLYDAARLAFYYGVSIQALLYRLRNIGLLPHGRLQELLEEDKGPMGRHLHSIMKLHDTDSRKDEVDLFRCTAINLALEAVRRNEISRAKCLEIGKLACSTDLYEHFEAYVNENISSDGIPLIPGENN